MCKLFKEKHMEIVYNYATERVIKDIAPQYSWDVSGGFRYFIGVRFGSVFGSVGSQLAGAGIKSSHTRQVCNTFWFTWRMLSGAAPPDH